MGAILSALPISAHLHHGTHASLHEHITARTHHGIEIGMDAKRLVPAPTLHGPDQHQLSRGLDAASVVASVAASVEASVAAVAQFGQAGCAAAPAGHDLDEQFQVDGATEHLFHLQAGALADGAQHASPFADEDAFLA